MDKLTEFLLFLEAKILQMTTAEEPGHVTMLDLDWLQENDYSSESLQRYEEDSAPFVYQVTI